MDAQTLRHRIERQVGNGATAVTLSSRGRRYVFYFFKRGRRLAVTIKPRLRLQVRPEVEALAAQLRSEWTCPECGKAFTRKGKQKFCTPLHAARHRKARWKRAQARARALAKVRRGELATATDRRLFR